MLSVLLPFCPNGLCFRPLAVSFGASPGEFVLCCMQPDEREGGREGGKSWGKGIEREETAGERGGMGKETEGKKRQRKKT